MEPCSCFCGLLNSRRNATHQSIPEEKDQRSADPVVDGAVSKENDIIKENAVPIEISAGTGKGVRTFSHEELAKATGYFSINGDNRLGIGGTGEVYRGKLENGEVVAIKKLKHQSNPENEKLARHQYKEETKILSRIDPHPNIVKVIGYCSDEANRLLVYEFVPNNSLRSCLHEKGQPTVNWSNRLKIALGTAEGLAYLHEICKPRIIHRDIKSDNILIDDKLIPKIGDFGLAKEFMNSNTHVSTGPRGTYFYEPPEYYIAELKTKLTEKSDVFSFGVVLLEIVTGRLAQVEDKVRLVDWALPTLKRVLETEDKQNWDIENYDNFIDIKLQKEYDGKEMKGVIYCAAACVYKPMKLRPKMSEIVEVLKGTKEPMDYIWMRNDTKYLYPGSPYAPLPEAKTL